MISCGFCCKQKAAYETCISDWSSDVCSSDLSALQASAGSGNDCYYAILVAHILLPLSFCCSRIRLKLTQPSSSQVPTSHHAKRSANPATRRQDRADTPRKSRRSGRFRRSEEHTSELQSLMRISYAVFCLKKKKNGNN